MQTNLVQSAVLSRAQWQTRASRERAESIRPAVSNNNTENKSLSPGQPQTIRNKKNPLERAFVYLEIRAPAGVPPLEVRGEEGVLHLDAAQPAEGHATLAFHVIAAAYGGVDSNDKIVYTL